MFINDSGLYEKTVSDIMLEAKIGGFFLGFQDSINNYMPSEIFEAFKDLDVETSSKTIILHYIASVLSQYSITEIEYRFIIDVLGIKDFTKEQVDMFLYSHRNRGEPHKVINEFLSMLLKIDTFIYPTNQNYKPLLPFFIEILLEVDMLYPKNMKNDVNVWLKNHLLYFENISKWYKSGFEF